MQPARAAVLPRGSQAAQRGRCRELVTRLGGHPAGDPAASEGGVERWFVAAVLLGSGRDEAVALGAVAALAGAGLNSPAGLAAAGPLAVEAALAGARQPRPDVAARVLCRASASLVREHGGSFEALAGGAEDAHDLARRVASLASGVGAATVARFLRPLRDLWVAALEVPLSPAARAAAVHLSLLREGEDEEGEPGALRAALRAEEDAPPLADLEAALERLGRRACLRRRPDRCPLGADCPAR